SGETDLRGVFVADAIRGTTTVIAQVNQSRYAFFRGKTHLGPRPVPAANARPSPPSKKPSGSKEDKLLEGLQRDNRRLQSEQQKQLEGLYKKDAKGVEAEKAF
ncbi:MAG: hypothetical protein IIA67_11865, partial [Planctomycetes bacterium]|nr:hypothetical protein [Planctomycetota bacterium]